MSWKTSEISRESFLESEHLRHGFKGGKPKNLDEARTFKKAGFSQASGRVLLICPSAADIVIVEKGGKAIFSTSANVTIFLPEEAYFGQTKRFLNQFLKQFAIDQPKPGYYVLNHLTMKNQHVGETWTEAADYLDGKIIALWGDEVLEQP